MALSSEGSCSFRLLVCSLICTTVISITSLSLIIWLIFAQPNCYGTGSLLITTLPPAHSTTGNGAFERVVSVGDLTIDVASGVLQWSGKRLEADLPMLKDLSSHEQNCSKTSDKLCLRSDNGYTLKISESTEKTIPNTHNCYVINQSLDTQDCNDELMNITTCFNYGTDHWYGAAQVHNQLWPIENWSIDVQEFVAGDSYFPGVFGGVLERYWLSSSGVSIHVPADIPLLVSMNASHDQRLCFSSRIKNTVYRREESVLALTVEVCGGGDLTSLYKFTSRRYWSKPIDRPNLDTLIEPIWSTWALYKKDINESLLVEFANQIAAHNLPISQLEIDDDWTPHYGDWSFNRDKFPNPKSLMSQLKTLVPAITVWVHPFINTNSQAFQQLSSKGLLMNLKQAVNTIPGLVTWWNSGQAGYLDYSNNETFDWFVEKMQSLTKEYGVDSFKFDAGETKWMPLHTVTKVPYFDPSEYIKWYVAAAIDCDKSQKRQEVRIGYQTQYAPILVRMMDRRSHWGTNNGLKTVIPTTLTFGLLGYPFVLPDMIGGNAYDGAVVDEELFIRWLQVNIFLPAIQFSIGPWSFNQTTVNHTREMLALRSSYRWMFDKLSQEAVDEGWPIIRPLWWIDPSDQTTFTIGDQFLLGNALLVAPVLEPQATSRDIYLPIGMWRDMNSQNQSLLTGKQWIRSYPSPLYTLPFFELVDEILT